jgi:tryptophan 2,3-dioxygenase
MSPSVHYHDYLQLDKILNAQFPESDKNQLPAHDEMLFIIIHQAYELWFKQLHYEVDSIVEIMKKPSLNDNAPELQTVVHRLHRITIILKLLVQQIDIMETMTPMDFLDFRDMLRPASGFQSWQFKELEAKIGLKYEHRYGKEYYTSQLRKEHIDVIKKAEGQSSLLELVNKWLERMPLAPSWPVSKEEEKNSFWMQYRDCYKNSLADAEKDNWQLFENTFFPTIENSESLISAKAKRVALFIMLYRGYPLLHLPFELLNYLM